MKSKTKKTKSESEDEEIDQNEEELNTKELLEPLDAESSSEDEDAVDPKEQQLKLDNSVGQKTKKAKNEKESDDEEENEKPTKPKTNPECTIFVGNIPTNTKLKQLKQFYNRFGEIISLRFRSENGKKVLNKTDRKKYASLNAYIVFKEPESAQKATETNGEVFKEKHLRCNLVVDKQDRFSQKLNTKSTVFVGNITFEANDEELYEFFSEKCGPIEYVRRIPKKGFAYVCFKPGVPLVRAMKLNDELFQGRKLRVQKWESKEQMAKKEKRLKKKLAGKQNKMEDGKGGNKKGMLNTTRPSNNPLLKKIKEKTKKDDTISKTEHKQKYRKGALEDSSKKDEKRNKKKAEFLGLRTDRVKKAKAMKKKQVKDKKLKKIVKVLTGPVKKTS